VSDIQKIFDSLLEDAVSNRTKLYRNGLEEKEKQSAHLPAENDQESKNGSSKSFQSDVEILKTGNVEYDDIVEKLNIIRSGRSFRDSAVKSAMEQYIDSMNKSEKIALLAFLKGIAQIVTGEVPGNQVPTPEDPPANTKIDSTKKSQKKSIKPNVIRISSPEKSSTKTSTEKEDTAAPTPIVPKKR